MVDSTTKEEGDWASMGGEETDRTLPERQFFFFRSATQAPKSIFLVGTGEKGNRLKLSVNESTCEGVGRVS